MKYKILIRTDKRKKYKPLRSEKGKIVKFKYLKDARNTAKSIKRNNKELYYRVVEEE